MRQNRARHDAHTLATRDQPIHQRPSEQTGATDDQYHEVLTASRITARCTASLTSMPSLHANAKHLHDAGHLREGLPITHATDVLWTFSAPEFFELLVLRCGWGVARFGDFVGASIAAALLRPV